jgi:ankyrin repeat protein
MLIDAGADVNHSGEVGTTPLWEAAIRGHVQVIQMLMDAGAKLDQGSKRWNSVLWAALYSRTPAVLQLLRGEPTAYKRCVYRSALCVAIRLHQDDMIRILLDGGQPETDSVKHRDGYAMQAAALKGDQETLKHLIDSGADVTAEGGYFSSVLYAATLCSRAEIVQMLLNAGADVNRQYGSESTPLELATAKGCTAIVSMLIAAGADLNEERDRFGGCALQIASLRGFTEIVRILLQSGANVNHSGGKYGSSLQAACTQGDGTSPLLVERDYEGTIQSLLAAGADVNQQGGKYGSALRAAMAWKNMHIANLLLEAGATPVDETDVPLSVSPSDDESSDYEGSYNLDSF